MGPNILHVDLHDIVLVKSSDWSVRHFKPPHHGTEGTYRNAIHVIECYIHVKSHALNSYTCTYVYANGYDIICYMYKYKYICESTWYSKL